MSRHLALVLTVSLLLLAGCSGGAADESGGPTTTGDPWAGWDPGAGSRITQLSDRLAEGLPGECNDLAPLDHSVYASTAETLKSDIPLGAADCTTLGEMIEFSTFADGPARSQFVDQRIGILCAAAKRGKYQLEGVRWVTDEDWSVQVDTESTGRKLAGVLGGTYETTLCPGIAADGLGAGGGGHRRTTGPAAGRRSDREMRSVAAARSFHLRKTQSVRRAHPGGLRALRWAGRDRGLDRGISPATVGPDSFAQSEATALCASTAVGKDVQAVRGPDWAIIATSPKLAERAASATGGEALTPAC